jgi:polyisoprenoid-binding protein YceI
MGTNKSSVDGVLKTQSWKIDEAHSKIRFYARHMVISEVEGQFDKFEFNMTNESDDLEQSEIELTIEAASLDTMNNDRDNHLKSADFFEVDKYPEISFKSTSIKKINETKYKLNGDLTIKGITKAIELDVTYGGQIKDPWGNIRAGFNVKGSLNRFDYGLKWNALIETGGAVVGKNININCDIEVIRVEEN